MAIVLRLKPTGDADPDEAERFLFSTLSTLGVSRHPDRTLTVFATAPPPLDREALIRSIVAALADRGWVLEQEEDPAA